MRGRRVGEELSPRGAHAGREVHAFSQTSGGWNSLRTTAPRSSWVGGKKLRGQFREEFRCLLEVQAVTVLREAVDDRL
jgi:hypothetical protein